MIAKQKLRSNILFTLVPPWFLIFFLYTRQAPILQAVVFYKILEFVCGVHNNFDFCR